MDLGSDLALLSTSLGQGKADRRRKLRQWNTCCISPVPPTAAMSVILCTLHHCLIQTSQQPSKVGVISICFAVGLEEGDFKVTLPVNIFAPRPEM